MLKALEDRIIIQVEKDEEQKTASGLIMQIAREIKDTGTVVAVGPGRTLPSGVQLEPDVAVGDKVVFNPMAVQNIEHDGQDYLIVFSRDILAVIDGE
jgi:chaperonin GroES